MIKVAVAGNFYPLHDGHIDHLEKASKLGDYLVAIIGPDSYLEMKGKPILLSLEARIKILKAIRWVNDVVVAIDEDGTVAKTLKCLRPTFYAKGGDRTPDNMPQNEIEACEEIGCRIIYGIGEKLNSSSDLIRRINE